MAQVAFEDCHTPSEHVRGATVGPRREVGCAQHAVCYRLLDESPAGRGMHKGTLAVLDGRLKVTRAQAVVGHAVGDPPELALIAQPSASTAASRR